MVILKTCVKLPVTAHYKIVSAVDSYTVLNLHWENLDLMEKRLIICSTVLLLIAGSIIQFGAIMYYKVSFVSIDKVPLLIAY